MELSSEVLKKTRKVAIVYHLGLVITFRLQIKQTKQNKKNISLNVLLK